MLRLMAAIAGDTAPRPTLPNHSTQPLHPARSNRRNSHEAKRNTERPGYLNLAAPIRSSVCCSHEAD